MENARLPKYKDMTKVEKIAYIMQWIMSGIIIVLIIMEFANNNKVLSDYTELLLGIDAIISSALYYKRNKQTAIILIAVGLIIMGVAIFNLITK